MTPLDGEGNTAGASAFYIYEPNSDRHVEGDPGYRETKNIYGDGGLVPADRLITQTTSAWTEVSPVQRNVVFRTMGRFTSDTKLFALKAGETVRIDLYIWLEGQDADCTNQIGEEAQIFANIQFAGTYEDQSGLRPID